MEIQSDRGSQFTSLAAQSVAQALKIRWRLSTPYHPQTQGVERMHRDLVKSLRAFVGHNPKTWCRYLPAVLMALRSTVSSATGYTPAQLVSFGSRSTSNSDARRTNPKSNSRSPCYGFVIAPSPNWQRKTDEVVSIDRLRRFITADGEPEPNIAPSLNQACQCPATSSPK